MKILHVTPYFAPAWAYGGTPRAVFEIARQQVLLGHQVTVLTTDAYQQQQAYSPLQEVMEGINIIRVKNVSNWLCWHLHFVFTFNLPVDFSPSDFNVIHLHEVRSWLNYLVMGQIKPQQKVICSPWGTLPYNNSQVFTKKLFDLIFFNQFFPRVDYGFAQTNHEKKVMIEFRLGRTITLMPLGTELKSKVKLPDKKAARKILNLPANQPIYLFLGRFSKYKGLNLLVRSFLEFKRKMPAASLICLGRDDGYLTALNQFIDKTNSNQFIKVCPPEFAEKKFLYYRAADWFVFSPIIYEETGTACLEALSCDTPVITTLCAEIPFMREKDGVIHCHAEKSALVKALVKSKNQLKVNSVKFRKIYNWDSIVQQMQKLYEKVN